MCFHGYSGRGYDDKFIANMNQLKSLFLNDPETKIQIISTPDNICESCPHLSDIGCIQDNQPDQENRVHLRDRAVMAVLNISDGQVFKVSDVFRLTESKITPEKLKDICGDCTWLPDSSCSANIQKDFWKK